MNRETREIFGVEAIEITKQEWEEIQKKGKGMYHIFIHSKHWIPLSRQEEYFA